MKRVVISVSSDLATDQRVKKICGSLEAMNFDIVLIGRRLSHSLPLKRNYKVIRMRLLFNKGFLFYSEYNIRLFLNLLFLKKDILLANDLDTLLPNFIISKLFNKKLVYDSHELFTEVPSLIFRPSVQKIWLHIENFIFPKLKNVYTVNNSIASYYRNKYKVKVHVIRNIAPLLLNRNIDIELSKKIKGNRKMIILQGTGINEDRGAEEAVTMMKYIENAILYIIGNGDVFNLLKKMVDHQNLKNKVIILKSMPYDQLIEYTKIADLGLSLDKGTSLNYTFSLPNKLFDYIQCRVPLLVSNMKLVSEFVIQNKIGLVTETHNPKKMAKIIRALFNNHKQYDQYKKNLENTSIKYTWENEEKKLKLIFSNLK